jgi:hypothetical protein
VNADTEDATRDTGRQILEEFPEIELDVSAIDDDKVVPDGGLPSPIEVYEASIIEQRVAQDSSESDDSENESDPDREGNDQSLIVKQSQWETSSLS